MLNAHLAELHRTPQRFCLQLCLSHSLASKVFNNLEVFPELLTLVSVPTARLCLNPQNSEVLLCTSIQRPQYSVTPSWHETTKNLKPETRHTPANANLQHTSTTYKNTHRHSHNTEIHAGKIAFVYIKMANACLYKGVLELSLALLLFSLLTDSLLFYP
jgi:hypothetical protein